MDRMCKLSASLAWILLLATGAAAAAGPREYLVRATAENPGAETPEPAVWMKRLVGHFTFDGLIIHREVIDYSEYRDAPPGPDGVMCGAARLCLPEWTQPVKGRGDCIEFADGPGLQCVINIAWPEQWRFTGKAQLGGVSDLVPGMVLGGIAFSTLPGGIRFLLVDKRGLAHPGSLALKGDSMIAKPPCVNLPGMERCENLFRITAPAGSNVIYADLSFMTRYVRSKLERKLCLGNLQIGTSDPCRYPPTEIVTTPQEVSTEWVEESYSLSFAMRRESQASDDPQPDALPAQGSR